MKRKPPALPALPGSAEETAAITAALLRFAAERRQRNLMAAVLLAQQAACGHGPLVDHFAELGRRYGSTLGAPAKARQGLRVIDGGAVQP